MRTGSHRFSGSEGEVVRRNRSTEGGDLGVAGAGKDYRANGQGAQEGYEDPPLESATHWSYFGRGLTVSHIENYHVKIERHTATWLSGSSEHAT